MDPQFNMMLPPIPPPTEQSLVDKLSEFGRSTGIYWNTDNQKFESTDPNLLQRIGRSLDPRTSLGSALGSMQASASNGDGTGMALSTLEAIPLFGALKLISTMGKGTIKDSSKYINDLKAFGTQAVGNVGISLINDAHDNNRK